MSQGKARESRVAGKIDRQYVYFLRYTDFFIAIHWIRFGSWFADKLSQIIQGWTS